MRYNYDQLLNKGYFVRDALHANADWTKVNVGDEVEFEDNFSLTVAYWRTIRATILKRAAELKAQVARRQASNDTFIIEFWQPECQRQAIRFPEPTGPAHKPMVTYPAIHRGSYYGTGEEDYMRFTSETGVVCVISQYDRDELLEPFYVKPKKYYWWKDLDRPNPLPGGRHDGFCRPPLIKNYCPICN